MSFKTTYLKVTFKNLTYEIRVMLLLSHSADQRPTQKRLEAYMSASSSLMGNDDDPKAVAQRVKLMELYILHVLPKVDEWQYAREFTQGSNDLDDDQKEVCCVLCFTLKP